MSSQYSLFIQVRLFGGPMDGWVIETPALDLMQLPKPTPHLIWVPLFQEFVGNNSTGTLDTTKTALPEKRVPYKLVRAHAQGRVPVFEYRYAPEEPSV